jgi:hypothetical protein
VELVHAAHAIFGAGRGKPELKVPIAVLKSL